MENVPATTLLFDGGDYQKQGELAEWLRSGLQIRPYRFDSGTRLQLTAAARLFFPWDRAGRPGRSA